MPNVQNIKGIRFGRLTVLNRVENNAHNKSMWLCVCDCGGQKAVLAAKLKNGETKSCGCLLRESSKNRRTTHGMSYTRTYGIWQHMNNRCHKPYATSFARYGGKGITVCDRWRNSFQDFLKDMGEAPDKKSLDRISGLKGYSPENCRWATPKEQSQNSSRPRLITFQGETRNVSEWAAVLGIDQSSLTERLSKWPLDRALTETRHLKRNRQLP